jgi:hypothetical protein
VVPDDPSIIGAVYTAKAGMGGVLFMDGEEPIMWHAQFPEDIQERIVSFDKPNG